MNKKKSNRITINFSKRLTNLMINKGYGSERSIARVNFGILSKAINCSNQMARKYILGEALPDPATIVKMANFLEVSPGWLLFGDNAPTQTQNNRTDLIGIDYELLHYILMQIAPLFSVSSNQVEIVNFIMDIVYDTSHLNADRKMIFKIIDMSVSSAGRFQKQFLEKRDKNDFEFYKQN